MAEYYNPAGGQSYSEIQAKKNPFLITQSLSASRIPTRMSSPMKDFGIFSIPAAIAAAAKAAAASAGTAAAAGAAKLGALAAKGGAAIAKVVGAKGVGAKLATTGAKLGAKAGAKWGATKAALKGGLKGVTKALTTKPSLKGILSGKKAAIGNVSKTGTEISVKGAGTGPQHTTGGGFGSTATPQPPPNFSATSKGTTTLTTPSAAPTTTTPGPSTPSTTATESSQSLFDTKDLAQKGVKKGIEKSKEKKREREQYASDQSRKMTESFSNMPVFGGGESNVPKEDLSSIAALRESSFLKLRQSIRSSGSPFVLGAKRGGSPLYSAKSKGKYDAAKSGMFQPTFGVYKTEGSAKKYM